MISFKNFMANAQMTWMFKNVGKLKTGADEHDPYYIFKLNCRSINGEQSYIFKSSKLAAEIALKMDSNLEVGCNNPLNEKYAYLDGMHSHVHGYKTLTLWTYHPRMRKVIKLASMEAERENTNSIVLFLELFNGVLRDISNTGIIVDFGKKSTKRKHPSKEKKAHF